MRDANVHDGDLIVIDRSRGTARRRRRRGLRRGRPLRQAPAPPGPDAAWLESANPDYPPITVQPRSGVCHRGRRHVEPPPPASCARVQRTRARAPAESPAGRPEMRSAARENLPPGPSLSVRPGQGGGMAMFAWWIAPASTAPARACSGRPCAVGPWSCSPTTTAASSPARAQAKPLIPMGAPAFQVRDAVREHGVVVAPPNYALYGGHERA